MTRSLPGLLAAALLAACPVFPAAAHPVCAAAARHASTEPRIRIAIDEARRQHHLFGGQLVDRDGGLFRLGFHEAEWDRLPGESTATWQRVATFWRAWSQTEPPDLITSRGLVARSAVERAAAGNDRDATSTDVAIHEALLRAAIVDTPWSAAFISYLMKTAGFSRAEFAFSDSHVDYVRAALETSDAEAAGRETTYAFRACDAATTPPRAGDLLCATRAGRAGVASFAALAAALADRPDGAAFPMHCELVVRADEGGDGKIDTIGGNVVQSVTLTRMTLNARKVLGARYVGAPQAPECASGAVCRGSLSRRPWVVVLQLRR